MIHIAVRVRELVSSNVDTLVSKAGEQHKMLGLLRSEIEEALIGLHGDLSKSQRAHERQVKATEKLADAAEQWTAKAKVAVDHGREDLARAALLARESDRKKVEGMRAEGEALAEQIAEMEAAIAELEAKRENVCARIADLPKPTDCDATGPGKDSRAARHLDRIDALDRRTSFTSSNDDEPSSADVDAEIAELTKASAIEAELEAMKAPTPAKKPAARKKAK